MKKLFVAIALIFLLAAPAAAQEPTPPPYVEGYDWAPYNLNHPDYQLSIADDIEESLGSRDFIETVGKTWATEYVLFFYSIYKTSESSPLLSMVIIGLGLWAIGWMSNRVMRTPHGVIGPVDANDDGTIEATGDPLAYEPLDEAYEKKIWSRMGKSLAARKRARF